jgi:hypothetical protein
MTQTTHEPVSPAPDAAWMLRLHGIVQEWLAPLDAQQTVGVRGPLTAVYAGLMFAFGLARIGARSESEQLLDSTIRTLASPGIGEVHAFLIEAISYRIRQSQEGRPHAGPLPQVQIDYLEHMDKMPRYMVDRVRQVFRIVEPERGVDPYGHLCDPTPLEREIRRLKGAQEVAEVVRVTEELLSQTPRKTQERFRQRCRVLETALRMAPQVGPDFLRSVVAGTIEAARDPRVGADPVEVWSWSRLLREGALMAARFDDRTGLQGALNVLGTLLQSLHNKHIFPLLPLPYDENIPAQVLPLLFEGVERLLVEVVNWDHQGHVTNPVEASLQVFVAAIGHRRGRIRESEAVLDAALTMLEPSCKWPFQERISLACAYAQALRWISPNEARRRLEELPAHCGAIADTYTTNHFFSLGRMQVVEAMVFTAAALCQPNPDLTVAARSAL